MIRDCVLDAAGRLCCSNMSWLHHTLSRMAVRYSFESRNWLPWSDRGNVSGAQHPGVYLIGRFDDNVPGSIDPIDPAILYIGETTGQTIGTRLHQFNRSAFTGRQAHSGGWTFHTAHALADPPPWLFVTTVNLDTSELLAGVFIKYVERLLLWNYASAHGRLPACNKG